ncbi:uncharacterized protein LOC142764930 [Rhipicephalus microplus]|uniref:uncharacterized protein LOC142764930 n=1 Tax=Rhipicephalus microplus TaxID=6941 RepID=UPI003F6BEEE9
MLSVKCLVTLFFLYLALSKDEVDATQHGTYERIQVEERIIPEDCDRRIRRCRYPQACLCPPLLHLGPRSWRRFTYSPRQRMCIPNAQRLNCNSFRTYRECEARCHPADAAR